MPRYLFTVSYDGSNYSGFQRQTNANSIQGEIEKAIKRMSRLEVTIHSAGRTDKGVHALAQTFHLDLDFTIEPEVWLKAINLRLPEDIIIKKIKKVSDTFHARHSAKSRVYYYKISKKPSDIFNQRFEVYVEGLNIELASKAIDKFIGTKDFTGFYKSSSDKDPIRTLSNIKIKETKDHYYFIFEGVSFLRYMIRSIMGTVISVSTNKMELNDIDLIFKTKDRSLAGKTAEAKALFLQKINYWKKVYIYVYYIWRWRRYG